MVIHFANGDVRKIRVTRSAVTSLVRIGIYDGTHGDGNDLLIQAIVSQEEKAALIKALQEA